LTASLKPANKLATNDTFQWRRLDGGWGGTESVSHLHLGVGGVCFWRIQHSQNVLVNAFSFPGMTAFGRAGKDWLCFISLQLFKDFFREIILCWNYYLCKMAAYHARDDYSR